MKLQSCSESMGVLIKGLFLACLKGLFLACFVSSFTLAADIVPRGWEIGIKDIPEKEEAIRYFVASLFFFLFTSLFFLLSGKIAVIRPLKFQRYALWHQKLTRKPINLFWILLSILVLSFASLIIGSIINLFSSFA